MNPTQYISVVLVAHNVYQHQRLTEYMQAVHGESSAMFLGTLTLSVSFIPIAAIVDSNFEYGKIERNMRPLVD